LLPADEITYHVKGCARNDRDSQKKIYTAFYGYAMAVCERYTNNHDDAVEILNDGFLKIFKEIHRYTPAYSDLVGSFKGWLRKIMIYTAIDHFRRNQKHRFMADIDNGTIQIASGGEDVVDRISYDEIIRSIQEVTPGYRTVFNLFVIEGFSHEEIAEKLGISVGTSKSNLSKARKQLQRILLKEKHFSLELFPSQSEKKVVR